jgi:4,5-DOPA dioxygenase extradiol
MPDPEASAAERRMPALYVGHGAPMLIDDPIWPKELADWAGGLPRPKAILVVSAHWQSAPLTLGAVAPVPLVYDFYGFPERYYRIRYDSPGAPELAARIKGLMPAGETVAQRPERGLDHGAYVVTISLDGSSSPPVASGLILSN